MDFYRRSLESFLSSVCCFFKEIQFFPVKPSWFASLGASRSIFFVLVNMWSGTVEGCGCPFFGRLLALTSGLCVAGASRAEAVQVAGSGLSAGALEMLFPGRVDPKGIRPRPSPLR